MRKINVVLLAAGSVAAVNAHAATDQQIGTAAVAKNHVTGTLGVAKRALKRGDGVFQNEYIITGRDAGAQFLFRDETALTMGPDSQLILDTFVYDPNRSTGKMTIRAVSGAFRFITGSGPKDGYKIATPVGTIGVRGTIVQFWLSGQQLILQLDEGGAYFCGAQKCVNLDKPGTYIVVTAQQVGTPQSNNECGSSGGSSRCSIAGDGDQTLYLQFLGNDRNFPPTLGNSLPPSPPGSTPGNGPPSPPPPTQTGFPPITNQGVGVPPGLNTNNLPPGLERRGPSFLPPGQARKP